MSLSLEDPVGDDSLERAQALRSSRVGVRLAALTWVMRRLESKTPELMVDSGAARAHEALKAISSDAIAHLAAHPSFGSWCRLTTKLVDRRAHVLLPDGALRSHLGALGWFVLAGATIEGTGSVMTVPVDPRGEVPLPGTGTTISVGPGEAGRWVDTEVSGDGVVSPAAELRRTMTPAPGVEVYLYPPFLGPQGPVDDPGSALSLAGRLWEQFHSAYPVLARIGELDGLIIQPCTPTSTPSVTEPGVARLDVSLGPEELIRTLASTVVAQREMDALGPPRNVGQADDDRLVAADDALAGVCRDLGCPDGITINRLSRGQLRTDPTIDHLSLLWVRDRPGFDRLVERLREVSESGEVVAQLLRAHVAYVTRDFPAAARGYASVLNAVPNDIDVWRDFSFSLRHQGFRDLADTWLFSPDLVMAEAANPGEAEQGGRRYGGLDADPDCAALVAAMERSRS